MEEQDMVDYRPQHDQHPLGRNAAGFKKVNTFKPLRWVKDRFNAFDHWFESQFDGHITLRGVLTALCAVVAFAIVILLSAAVGATATLHF